MSIQVSVKTIVTLQMKYLFCPHTIDFFKKKFSMHTVFEISFKSHLDLNLQLLADIGIRIVCERQKIFRQNFLQTNLSFHFAANVFC